MTAPTAYRPDIDGLRAVAVLLVLFFHLFPDELPGGFVGVDIFFVISGYLITGIIADEIDRGRFSLANFYARRVRRLFPALIVVLTASLCAGWFFLLPDAFVQLARDVGASMAFSANISLMLQAGYFDEEAIRKPLLHLWSLGIEEQFYLAWPLLLVIASRWKLNRTSLVATIGLGSFALNVALLSSYPIATFYLPFTRAFELLAGAALTRASLPDGKAFENMRAGAGAALVAASSFFLSNKSEFPGWLALLPVSGAALMVSAPGSWFNRVLLAHPRAVAVGIVSYPIYLWHWPLLSFVNIAKYSPPTLLERWLIVAASILLAWLTYRYVEAPIRFRPKTGRRTLVLCGGISCVAILAGAVIAGGGFALRFPQEIRDVASVRTWSDYWRFGKCLIDPGGKTPFAPECVDRDRRPPLIVVWGDSTAAALLPGLREEQRHRDFSIAQFTASSCPPLVGIDVPKFPYCRGSNDRTLGVIAEVNPDIVLLHGTWDKFPHLARSMDTAIIALRRVTKARIVVLGATPAWQRGLPPEILRYYGFHHAALPQRWRYGVYGGEVLDTPMREAVVPLGADFISAWDVFCNPDGCLTRTGDSMRDITTTDRVHITESASRYLVKAVIDRVLGDAAEVANDPGSAGQRQAEHSDR